MESATTDAQSPNQAILDEANQGNLWFRAKKTRPLWAKRLEADQEVTTLEGAETVKAGDYLCRGEAGDIWPQSAKSLNSKYDPEGDVDGEGWQKYVPKPDADGVLAAKIEHPFTVHASWGDLSGKAGDFLIKGFADHDEPYPTDAWLVDSELFEATYQRLDE